MARYLTPSKIGLLALVALYTDSVVPTAATIPLLSFLVTHLLPSDAQKPLKRSHEPARKFAVVIDDFQRATITHASGIPGRTLWDLFLKKLWEINSLDALHVFFEALSLLLAKGREELQKDAEHGIVHATDSVLLSRTSPLGAFVRRAQLEFTRLQFHDRTTLWKAFVTYREPTLGMWKRRNPAAGKTSFDINLQEDNLLMMGRMIDVVYGDLADEERQAAEVSTDDVEKVLEFQVNEMQSTLADLDLGQAVASTDVLLRDGYQNIRGHEIAIQEYDTGRRDSPKSEPLRKVCKKPVLCKTYVLRMADFSTRGRLETIPPHSTTSTDTSTIRCTIVTVPSTSMHYSTLQFCKRTSAVLQRH